MILLVQYMYMWISNALPQSSAILRTDVDLCCVQYIEIYF